MYEYLISSMNSLLSPVPIRGYSNFPFQHKGSQQVGFQDIQLPLLCVSVSGAREPSGALAVGTGLTLLHSTDSTQHGLSAMVWEFRLSRELAR